MALTAIERSVLIAAREVIRTEKENFVCHAISKAFVPLTKQRDITKAKDRLCAYVRSQLGGNSTLNLWMAKRTGRWMNDYDLERKTRIAWITWMLGEPVELDEQTARGFAAYLNPRMEVYANAYDPLAPLST